MARLRRPAGLDPQAWIAHPPPMHQYGALLFRSSGSNLQSRRSPDTPAHIGSFWRSRSLASRSCTQTREAYGILAFHSPCTSGGRWPGRRLRRNDLSEESASGDLARLYPAGLAPDPGCRWLALLARWPCLRQKRDVTRRSPGSDGVDSQLVRRSGPT
jgi:hypothetical protein